MPEQNPSLEALQDIRRMMQRSSRFLSLSGLSGIAAGVWAIIGAYIAHVWIKRYYQQYDAQGYHESLFYQLKWSLFVLAVAVLAASLVSAFYFTWRKAGKSGQVLWDRTARNLMWNTAIPLVAGGFFILAMLQYSEWRFIAPACLIFYGLALVNGSKYTLSEVRYLGLFEIVLGLINTQFTGYGLYFWVAGFGVLHIIYGFVMWQRYDRHPQQ